MWWSWAAACVAFLLGNGLQISQRELWLSSVGQAWAVALGAAFACALCLWGRVWLARRIDSRSGPLNWGLALALGLALAALGWAQAEARAASRMAQTWPASAGPVWLIGVVRAVNAVPSGVLLEVQVDQVGRGRCTAAGKAPMAPEAGRPWPERVSLSMKVAVGSPGLAAGERWCWPVRLHEPGTLSNPAGFDAQRWWFEKGVRAQGRVVDERSAGPALRLAPPSGSAGLIERWRASLAQRVKEHVPPGRAQGLVLGLTIGEQSAIDPADWDTLRDTGLAHVASISGTHVLMMAWLVAGCAGWLWRRSAWLMNRCPAPVVGRWSGLLAALAYALLAGWGVPAQRTVLMLAVVTLLRAGALRWPPLLVLLAAAVAVVWLDPWAPGQAGFWLSFAAVALLMLSDEGGRAVSTQPATLVVPGTPGAPASGGFSRLWRDARQSAGAGLRTQALASVALAPLSMVFFQQVSLVGLLANVPGLPVFTFVLTPLALAGLGWPWLWHWVPPVADALFAFLQWMARWPWATWSAPEVWPWVLAPALLAVAWTVPRWPPRWRWWPVPLLCWLLWPPGWAQRWPAPDRDHFEVHVADVGQGTAVLLRTRQHALLYDTGPEPPGASGEGRDAGRRVLLGLMRSLGVRQLDRLVISHGDLDHIGGARSVLAGVPVRSLVSSVTADDPHLQWPADPTRVPPLQPCVAGEGWTWDGVRFEFLHPTADDLARRDALSGNAVSCVLRVHRLAHPADSLLLTGDAEREQEAAMLQRDAAGVAARVLVVPHHGSLTSSTPAFVAAVRPELAVVQAGARNRYGHPAPAVMRRYEDAGVPVKTSAQCGDWYWRTQDGPPVEAGRCWRDTSRRYWHEVPQAAPEERVRRRTRARVPPP